MIPFVALLLIPPPVPPPPPDQLAIAVEIRSTAPFDQSAIDDAESIALGRTATATTKLIYPAVEEAQAILARLWSTERDVLRTKAFACFDEINARVFDASELGQLRNIVDTQAGKRLWQMATRESLRYCFDKTALDWIGYEGIRDPLKWAAEQKKLAVIPLYDRAKVSLVDHAATLERQCGRKATGALAIKGNKVGFRAGWIERDLRASKGNAFWCINSLSKLGGYPLVAFSK